MSDFAEQLRAAQDQGLNIRGETVFTDAADYIDEQAAEIERLRNPWVSVDDRLPEHEVEVLTYSTKYGNCLDVLIFEEGDSFFYDDDEGKVTRWMPIPSTGESNDTTK